MTQPAITPEPPYYAVIFTSIRNDGDGDYDVSAARMLELASQQAGFLGFETARQDIGISVSYWTTLDAIKAWKANAEHLVAQQRGRNDWYKWYRVRISRVEREYGC
jgi:heme-degrading monooxygenase HmoA